jgi:hypothetical protein
MYVSDTVSLTLPVEILRIDVFYLLGSCFLVGPLSLIPAGRNKFYTAYGHPRTKESSLEKIHAYPPWRWIYFDLSGEAATLPRQNAL